jgi:hypothetical protein
MLPMTILGAWRLYMHIKHLVYQYREPTKFMADIAGIGCH